MLSLLTFLRMTLGRIPSLVSDFFFFKFPMAFYFFRQWSRDVCYAMHFFGPINTHSEMREANIRSKEKWWMRRCKLEGICSAMIGAKRYHRTPIASIAIDFSNHDGFHYIEERKSDSCGYIVSKACRSLRKDLTTSEMSSETKANDFGGVRGKKVSEYIWCLCWLSSRFHCLGQWLTAHKDERERKDVARQWHTMTSHGSGGGSLSLMTMAIKSCSYTTAAATMLIDDDDTLQIGWIALTRERDHRAIFCLKSTSECSLMGQHYSSSWLRAARCVYAVLVRIILHARY